MYFGHWYLFQCIEKSRLYFRSHILLFFCDCILLDFRAISPHEKGFIGPVYNDNTICQNLFGKLSLFSEDVTAEGGCESSPLLQVITPTNSLQ